MRWLITLIGILASVAGIYTFVTGQNLAPSFLSETKSPWLERYDGRWTSEDWTLEIIAADTGKSFEGVVKMRNPGEDVGERFTEYHIDGEVDGPTAMVSAWESYTGRKVLQDVPAQISGDRLKIRWIYDDDVEFARAN